MEKYIDLILSKNFDASCSIDGAFVNEIFTTIQGNLNLIKKRISQEKISKCNSISCHCSKSVSINGETTAYKCMLVQPSDVAEKANNLQHKVAIQAELSHPPSTITQSHSQKCEVSFLKLPNQITHENIGMWAAMSLHTLLEFAHVAPTITDELKTCKFLKVNSPVPSTADKEKVYEKLVSSTTASADNEHTLQIDYWKSNATSVLCAVSVEDVNKVESAMDCQLLNSEGCSGCEGTDQKSLKTNADQLKKKINYSIIEANALLDFTWQKLNTGHWKDVPLPWRYCYAWSSLCMASLLLCRLFCTLCMDPLLTILDVSHSVAGIVRALDMGLLMGAPIQDSPLPQCASSLNSIARLGNLFQDCQSYLRKDQFNNNNRVESASEVVSNVKVFHDTDISHQASLSQSDNFNHLLTQSLEIIYLPPVTSFYISNVQSLVPVKLVGVTDSWPAHKKWSVEYLRKIAGARTVPIEIGAKYTDNEWSQELITLDSYLTSFINPASKPKSVGYLAQHQLLDQIPELRDDIFVPDYCHLGHSEPRIHAWIGPEGTVSPLHNDPDHNILAQVVGFKYVRLYTEDQTPYLYPHEDPLLSNTSRVDVEGDNSDYPDFEKASYHDLILGPGDCVYIPPKCWHYIRSLTVSFSVSFWWM